MADAKKMTLTSVKVKSELFENFKIECVRRKFSFQKLADRALFLYLTDEDFRKQISNQTNIYPIEMVCCVYYNFLCNCCYTGMYSNIITY